jgi:hypothetical protein
MLRGFESRLGCIAPVSKRSKEVINKKEKETHWLLSRAVKGARFKIECICFVGSNPAAAIQKNKKRILTATVYNSRAV